MRPIAEVAFHPLASRDYREASRWYGRRAERGFEREVEAALEVIAADPLRYADAEAGCREAILVRYPYSVVCRVEEDGSVLVVAVAHSSREPGYWQGRL